jgi:hypothetical protein
MPRVGVIFELRRAETRPGESICVSGSQPELGAWTPNTRLRTSDLEYPRWYLRSPLWLEFERSSGAASSSCLALEYKYVRDRQALDSDPKARYGWEDAIRNRRALIPCEDGAIYIVSDADWNVPSIALVKRWLPPIQPGQESSLCSQRKAVSDMKIPTLCPEQTMPTISPVGPSFVSHILSPRRKEAVSAIELEFDALGTPELTSRAPDISRASPSEEEMEALRRENLILRKRLLVFEKAQQEDEESVWSLLSGKSSIPEDTTLFQSHSALSRTPTW